MIKTERGVDVVAGLKNAEAIQEGRDFERAMIGKAKAEGKDVRTQVRLVPQNGQGNVKGNRTNVDQLIRNEDGSYTLVETKLRSTTPLSKGQKTAKRQIEEGNGLFEVRSDELRDWGIKNGDFIIIDNWDFNSKYK